MIKLSLKRMPGVFLPALACLLAAQPLNARNLDYPAGEIRFDEKAAESGAGKILEIAHEASVTDTTRWNGIKITVPGPLKFNPSLFVEGKAKVESANTPSHVACLLYTPEGKVGFVRLVSKPEQGGDLEFGAYATKPEIIPESKVSEPFTTEDTIEKLIVYVSFPESAASTFTLSEFSLQGK